MSPLLLWKYVCKITFPSLCLFELNLFFFLFLNLEVVIIARYGNQGGHVEKCISHYGILGSRDKGMPALTWFFFFATLTPGPRSIASPCSHSGWIVYSPSILCENAPIGTLSAIFQPPHWFKCSQAGNQDGLAWI